MPGLDATGGCGLPGKSAPSTSVTVLADVEPCVCSEAGGAARLDDSEISDTEVGARPRSIDKESRWMVGLGSTTLAISPGSVLAEPDLSFLDFGERFGEGSPGGGGAGRPGTKRGMCASPSESSEFFCVHGRFNAQETCKFRILWRQGIIEQDKINRNIISSATGHT